MNGTPDIDDLELHAYIDGELEAGRCRAVEARLRADPALADRVAQFRADKEMLKRVYGPVAKRPIPVHWLALADSYRPRSAVTWRLVGSIAASLLVVIALGVGYLQMRHEAGGGVVQEALEVRRNAEHPERIIAVASGSDASRYDDVLRTTLRSNVKVPDLRRMGYRLTGIRVFASIGAAEMVYRDAGNRLFTMYVRRSNGQPRFDQFERDGLRVCIWQDEELSAVMAGNMSTAAMQRLASLAYTGLTL